MFFRVLGPLETQQPGVPTVQWVTRKPATLLATLLLNAGHWVSCDQLTEVIWHGQVPPLSARSNIKSYVWQIRRALPPAADGPRIESRSGAYRLHVADGELDVDCFRRHAAEARKVMADGDLPAAVRHLTAALGLWRGTPFPELVMAAEDPLVANLVEMRWELRETLADVLAEQGQYREAIVLLRELTAEGPLREGAWTRLVRTFHQAGRRSEALATYEHARAVLADELGVEPGQDLADAHRRASTEQPGRPRVLERPRCDLPRDVPDFTGRADQVARLTELGRSSATSVPVAVLDGMPGVGKTALAVHVARRIAGQFPDGQLFIDLGAQQSSGDVLARLLRTIGISARAIPATTDERAAMWRSALAGHRMSLVLDDARSAEQVEPLLPGNPGCMVLVTSRARLRLAGADGVTLDPLGRVESAALFLAGAGDWRTNAEPQAIAEIIRLCEGVPAAIRAAVGLFRSRPKWTVGQLVAHLADEPGLGVAALIESAYRRLADPERRMLHVAGLAPDGELDVPRAAQAAGISAAEARQRLENLADHHLLGQPSPGQYAVHSAVRDFARLAARVPRTA
ncbi:MAG: BTAD domain-containing putative transcriptional regulator [Kibdelosporangium sp.]